MYDNYYGERIYENTKTIISNQEINLSNQEKLIEINSCICLSLTILFLFILLKESFKGKLP